MDNAKSIELSVVATIYNDEKIVPLLIEEILAAVNPLNITYEVILVNDRSVDHSEEAIRTVCSKNPQVKGVSLARNFGQQIAMSAGIANASGKYVLIMDGDLQNPPEEIPNLYAAIREANGRDIVYAVSKTRNSIWDEFTSNLFWSIITRIFQVNIIKNQLMMKIMTREFIDKYNLYGEISRTVSGIVNDISSNHGVIEIQNQKRRIGKSHYSFFRRLSLLIDIIISLSNAPLNSMIYLGFTIWISTVFASVYYFIKYLFYDIQPGFTSILLSIFFFGSLILLMLGFIGKYLANINIEVRRRPLYHVREKINF
jgi:glycosyltransferase involved in cell wall biosynthesis